MRRERERKMLLKVTASVRKTVSFFLSPTDCFSHFPMTALLLLPPSISCGCESGMAKRRGRERGWESSILEPPSVSLTQLLPKTFRERDESLGFPQCSKRHYDLGAFFLCVGYRWFEKDLSGWIIWESFGESRAKYTIFPLLCETPDCKHDRERDRGERVEREKRDGSYRPTLPAHI